MATTTERLELLITSNARDLVNGVKQAEGSFGGLTGKLGDFDGKMAGTNSKLQALGLQGITSGRAIEVGIAVGSAAMAGFATWAAAGVQKQLELAGAVQKVSEASGLAAEDASRLVEVTGDYGVNVDSVERAMWKLSGTVQNSADKFADHDVKIRKNKDGTVDLLGTLENVQAAYLATGDATERNALLMDLFGKSGKDLIPVLERTKDLGEALAKVPESRILSQSDLDNAEKYRLAMDDLKDVLGAFQRDLGSMVIPALAEFVGYLNQVLEAAHSLKGAVPDLGAFGGALKDSFIESFPVIGPTVGIMRDLGDVIGIGGQKSNEFADAQKRVAEATQEVARLAADDSTSSRDLKEAKRELADAQNDLAGKTQAVANALQSENDKMRDAALLADQRIGGLIGLASADLQYQTAIENRQVAEQRLNDLVAQGTTSGREYESATRAVEQAQIAEISAALAVESQLRTLRSEVDSGKLSHQEYAARVEELKAKYPELGAAIDAVTGQVKTHHSEIDAVPDHKNTNFTATDNVSWVVDRIKAKIDSVAQQGSMTLGAIGAAVGGGRAAGGPVSANSLYMVGERGPELFVPSTAGQIVPNHQLGTVGGGTNNYQISVTVAPGGSPAETGRAIVEAIRAYENRSGATWRAA